MKIGIAQINATVGDFPGNRDRILRAYRDAVAKGADLVITPELVVTGYPPQDLIFREKFVDENLAVVDALAQEIGEVPLLVGYVERHEGRAGKPLYNAAALLRKGHERRRFFKSLLPTYDVFDEARYFQPAPGVGPVQIADREVGVTICEDIWNEPDLPSQLYVEDPPATLREQGMELLVNMSASPFHSGKPTERYELLHRQAKRLSVPLIYCNAVGGNDQLVFDGNSIVFDAKGNVIAQLPGFIEAVEVVDLGDEMSGGGFVEADECEELFNALVLGVRDYMRKCGFRTAALALSGGIDSALTAVIAAEAVGAQNVLGVSLPSEFSSEGSIDDAVALAKNLGMNCERIPIQNVFESLKREMAPVFGGRDEDLTEENMQARIRGLMMMAISNKLGPLLLTTGNKSELAVGYCTIYGDMCGGLAVISDVSKTQVYSLARWINRTSEVIPWNTIEKPPSAELRPDQKDQDTLPPYEVLDAVLEMFVERRMSIEEIVANGFEEEMVRWITRRVLFNEWKRHQAAPGIRVTRQAFGLGRRIPIAQRFRG